jgi:subtilisin family serine protease
MNSTRFSRIVTWSITLSLLFSVSFGILVVDKACAKANGGGDNKSQRDDKVSSDLRNRVRHGQTSGNDELVNVIVQFNGPPSAAVQALLRRDRVRVRNQFQNFNAHAVELPASVVDELASFKEVNVVSLDAEIRSMGHVSLTTGADAARPGNGGVGVDGTGIGIAVLDSGIDTDHVAFLDKTVNNRIALSKDFTGENRVDDPYGHGTHVASIAAGNGRVSNAKYVGIAPNANILNLRVLNGEGSGSVSNILSALDWVMTQRSTYNIRVVNLSLGMPAIQSYQFDPVCLAVRKLVDAGIVVVAAAGNNGKDDQGRKIYGAIHSPGIEPSAITVGASNTFGTDSRSDDTVTTYSSRGPTRSYWTDTAGVKHYDNILKPDLVAPGNKIVDAEADGNLLVTQHPQLDAGVSNANNRREMYLNGTSMATPVVAGAAALMLQANPKLTPNMVKAILSYTAQTLVGPNKFEQGAGEVNIEGAVRLARLVRTDLTATTAVGAPMLTTDPPIQQTTIGSFTFNWFGKVNLNCAFADGVNLVTKYQGIYALGVIASDGVIVTDGVIASDGVIITDGVIASDGVIITDGVIIGDGVIITDGVIASDGVIIADLSMQAQSAAFDGDDTPYMEPVVDTGVDCLDY